MTKEPHEWQRNASDKPLIPDKVALPKHWPDEEAAPPAQPEHCPACFRTDHTDHLDWLNHPERHPKGCSCMGCKPAAQPDGAEAITSWLDSHWQEFAFTRKWSTRFKMNESDQTDLPVLVTAAIRAATAALQAELTTIKQLGPLYECEHQHPAYACAVCSKKFAALQERVRELELENKVLRSTKPITFKGVTEAIQAKEVAEGQLASVREALFVLQTMLRTDWTQWSAVADRIDTVLSSSSDLAAEHDRRVAAQALRDAADLVHSAVSQVSCASPATESGASQPAKDQGK